MRGHDRILALAATACLVAGLVSGCSSSSNAASSLATTASDAAAAAQTAAYDLHLQLTRRTIPGVSSTALGDVITDLQKADSTLTGSPPPTAVRSLHARALALVRRAEDATREAQGQLGKPDAASALTRLQRTLHQISQSLSKIEERATAES